MIKSYWSNFLIESIPEMCLCALVCKGNVCVLAVLDLGRRVSFMYGRIMTVTKLDMEFCK